MQNAIAANIVIPYYSSYGTTHRLAKAVEKGAGEAGASVRLRRVPELPGAEEAMSGQVAYDAAQAEMADVPRVDHEDLRWADGIIWGTPTRFGRADLDRQGRSGQAVHRYARRPVVRGRAGGKGHWRLRIDRIDPRGARDHRAHEPRAADPPRDGLRRRPLQREPADDDHRGGRRLALRDLDDAARGERGGGARPRGG